MSFLFIVADYASSPTSGRIKERVLSHVRVAFLVLHTHMPISQAYCTQYKQALPCWNCQSFKFCKLAFQDLVKYYNQLSNVHVRPCIHFLSLLEPAEQHFNTHTLSGQGFTPDSCAIRRVWGLD